VARELHDAMATTNSRLEYSTQAADGVYLVRTLISNVAFISAPDMREWVLVDAGMPGYADKIRHAAEECFGSGATPASIVLTHGHFDHRGSLPDLLDMWNVPVYAHPLELPHLTGRLDYPPPDPLVGGGAMAWTSRLLPRRSVDVGPSLRALPQDRTVPGAPGWEWLHTPGHTVGHVSLFQPLSRVLVAGDAICTTKQESLVDALTYRPTIQGPPAYFTMDWDAARESVRHLAGLQPEVLVSGHGAPLEGRAMRRDLDELAARFDQISRPRFGRYARTPARLTEFGTFELPPDPFPLVAASIVAATLGSIWLARHQDRQKTMQT
jgi:glyoxylase-like metal-dependent hydrolase (beta-lactamase superfamily II)